MNQETWVYCKEDTGTTKIIKTSPINSNPQDDPGLAHRVTFTIPDKTECTDLT